MLVFGFLFSVVADALSIELANVVVSFRVPDVKRTNKGGRRCITFEGAHEGMLL